MTYHHLATPANCCSVHSCIYTAATTTVVVDVCSKVTQSLLAASAAAAAVVFSKLHDTIAAAASAAAACVVPCKLHDAALLLLACPASRMALLLLLSCSASCIMRSAAASRPEAYGAIQSQSPTW
jgi:hypothetical protein